MTGRFYVAVVQAVLIFGSETWVLNLRFERSLEGFHHRAMQKMGRGNGTQTSTGWDMGVYIYWGSTGNGGAGGYRGVYCPPPEHGHTVHCDSYYHGILSGGRAEAGTAPIQDMVVAFLSGYPGDKGGACSRQGGGGQ